MKLFYAFLISITFIGMGFVFFDSVAYAENIEEDEVNTGTIQYYDENNNPIYPYSEEELEEFQKMHDDKTDGSGNTTDPHSETELKQLEDTYEKGLRLQEKTLDTNSLARARWSEYSFGKTIVSKYVWVKKGAGFLNPDHIDAELMNRPPVFEIHAHGASSGNFFGKVVFEKKSYWVVAPWEHLPRSRSYKFKLVNGGSKGTVDIKHGNVRYN